MNVVHRLVSIGLLLLALAAAFDSDARGSKMSSVILEYHPRYPKGASRTLTQRVAVGDTIRAPAGSLLDKPPFVVLEIDAPDRIWVRLVQPLRPWAPRLQSAGPSDPVLVTSVPRHFGVSTGDGWAAVALRTARPESRASRHSLRYEKQEPVVFGPHGPDELVWSSESVSLARAVSMRLGNVRDRIRNVPLITFRVEESWKGAPKIGDSIVTVHGMSSMLTSDSTVQVNGFSTPIFRGDLVILFVRADQFHGTGAIKNHWECALLAQKEKLVFSHRFGRGVPLDSVRGIVRRLVEEEHEPFTGRLVGRLLDESGAGIQDADVRDIESDRVARSGPRGEFVIYRLPIGERRIEIAARCHPTERGLLPVTDEGKDTLIIRLGPRLTSGPCD